MHLLAGTKYGVYICSLGDGGETHVLTRDQNVVDAFVKRWDKPGRGVFSCVSTLKKLPRSLKNVAEIATLHADIDGKDHDRTLDEIKAIVLGLEYPPTMIVTSGNGLHLYWRLSAVCTDTERAGVALKRLAVILGGDRAVTHCAALMRLPGSHNTKGGAWKPVEIVHESRKSYRLKALEDWLAEAQPVLMLQKGADFFAAHGAAFKASVDVPARLRAMTVGGSGDTGVHLTQLSCVSSLASRRDGGGGYVYDEDEVVKKVLDATRLAAVELKWNWATEERKLRKMYRSWLIKKKEAA